MLPHVVQELEKMLEPLFKCLNETLFTCDTYWSVPKGEQIVQINLKLWSYFRYFLLGTRKSLKTYRNPDIILHTFV